MAGEKQIHAGHRQRMHQRVQKYGLESLAEHEMLEYLLYFTNPRRDTNPTAHALLERFEKDGLILLTRTELNRKYYQLTPQGDKVLQDEYQRIRQQAADMEQVLREEETT